MRDYKNIFKKIILIITIIILLMINTIGIKAQEFLTNEEKAYIEKNLVIKAVSLDGIAPIQYNGVNGEVRGISRRVLEEISDMTGLVFEYKLYDSLDKAFKSDADIFFGIPYNYAPFDMVLSQPYLKSQTILYINSSLDSKELEDKVYAAVRGSELPEGVKEENSIYFDTREESLDAVETGKADYGYGNAYSVAFYTLQNNYKNIVTIPKEKESREYCIGLFEEDELLLSILNKSINAIDENYMQMLILDVTSHIDRKITFTMIIDEYAKEIFFVVYIVIIILLFSAISNISVNKKLRMQNRRYEILARISNEYLYEYVVKSNRLELSKKCIQLFGTQEKFNEVNSILKDHLSKNDLDESNIEIKLPLANGDMGVFKTITLSIDNDKGELVSIIGKLIDISKEAAEKEELLIKSQLDGLTGLYNHITTKELITESIRNRDEYQIDAFIIIDCDKLKDINDTYGHLMGDCILENISKSLKLTFRNTDIIGRIGGDEFCVYIKDVPSADFIQKKCERLISIIKNTMEDIYVSVSIGIVFVNEKNTYESLFEKADNAMYQAKRKGRAQIVIGNSYVTFI